MMTEWNNRAEIIDLSTLGACPFCHKKEAGLESCSAWRSMPEGYCAYCSADGCLARGPVRPTKAEAIAAWNGAGRWRDWYDDPPTAEDERVIAIFRQNGIMEIMRPGKHEYAAGAITHWQPLPPPPTSSPT